MAGDRRFQYGDRQRRARGLAEAHAEIEQRLLAQLFYQAAMAGLGRAMGDEAVVERVRLGGKENGRRRGRGETIEQHGKMGHARRDDGASDRRQLAAPHPAHDLEGIGELRAVKRHGRIDHGDLAGQPLAGNAGAGPDPIAGAPAKEAAAEGSGTGRVGDAHLAEA